MRFPLLGESDLVAHSQGSFQPGALVRSGNTQLAAGKKEKTDSANEGRANEYPLPRFPTVTFARKKPALPATHDLVHTQELETSPEMGSRILRGDGCGRFPRS